MCFLFFFFFNHGSAMLSTKKNHFFFFSLPLGMWDLSSLTRDQTHAHALVVQNLNHWTAKEVPKDSL